jgi:hypothetical protein
LTEVAAHLAAQPRFYVEGLVKLAPKPKRPRVREVIQRVGYVLRWWMIGQLVPMVAIGILTAVGLKLIGVQMWLTLGLLAALFNFIPNFGPMISGVPAVLIAFASYVYGLHGLPAVAGGLLVILAITSLGGLLDDRRSARLVETIRFAILVPAAVALVGVIAGLEPVHGEAGSALRGRRLGKREQERDRRTDSQARHNEAELLHVRDPSDRRPFRTRRRYESYCPNYGESCGGDAARARRRLDPLRRARAVMPCPVSCCTRSRHLR